MREIKFRAWYRRYKVMWDVWLMQYENRVMNKETAEYAELDEVDLMQYTGLKDKNGKEIYEGDIIKVLYLDCDTERTCVSEVSYIKNQATFNIFAGDYSCDGCICMTETLEVEIIGNKLDNPELLRG